MYNNSYGYGVYKRSQVNIGNPYQIKTPSPVFTMDDIEKPESVNEDFDEELLISQDILYKAKEEAASILREAQLEAERIINEAKEEAEGIKEETELKAKEEGYRFGEVLAQQHYNDLLTEAQEFRDRSKAEYEETILSLEADMLNMVINIAAKVIGDEIRNNSDAILGIVRETINACTNHESIVLKVSPNDYDYVIENEERLRSMVRDLNDLDIRKDGTLAKGSCVIDNGFGSVDGSSDTRFEKIRKAFFEVLGQDHCDRSEN